MSRYSLGPAITEPLAQIHDGGAILGRRYGRWVWPADEDEQSIVAALRRLAGTGAIVYLGATLVTDSPGWMWPATIGGAIAAHRAGRDSDRPTDGEQHDQAEGEFVEPDVLEFVALLRELLPDGPGAHLVEVAQALDEDIPRPAAGWSTKQVRALAAEAALPVVSTRSRTRPGSSPGIRRKDLPPPPVAETTPVAVVAAGQTEDSDSDRPSDRRSGALIIHDPADPTGRRHTVPRRAA